MNKRGISDVVATVLIILVTVAAATIVWTTVIPLIKNNLESADVFSKADISIDTSSGYTGYDPKFKLYTVRIVKGPNEVNISKIEIIATNQGNSKKFTYDFGLLPNQGKVFYLFLDNQPEKVEIAPVFKSGTTEKTGDIVSKIETSNSLDVSRDFLFTGLVGYWKLDDNLNDVVGGNSGTVSEGAFVEGKVGKAYKIIRYDIYPEPGKGIVIPYSSKYDIADKLTLSIWMKDPLIPPKGWFIPFARQQLDSVEVPYALTICNGASCGMMTRVSSMDYYSGLNLSGGYIPDNNWHHIVGTFDKTLSSNNLKIYIDGILKGQTTRSSNLVITPNANLLIGGSYSWPYPSVDLIADEVMIYNRALSNTEIKQLYDLQK